MKLQFDDLDLEPEPSCNYDYVLIFDNVSGRFMGKFCGSSCAGSTIVLESREARVVLRSDGSSNGAGFSLQAWRAAPCKWQWHRADKKKPWAVLLFAGRYCSQALRHAIQYCRFWYNDYQYGESRCGKKTIQRAPYLLSVHSTAFLYVDVVARSRYLRQGKVITSHSKHPCMRYLLLATKSSYKLFVSSSANEPGVSCACAGPSQGCVTCGGIRKSSSGVIESLFFEDPSIMYPDLMSCSWGLMPVTNQVRMWTLTAQIAKTRRSTSARHRSNTKLLVGVLVDVNLRVFAIKDTTMERSSQAW